MDLQDSLDVIGQHKKPGFYARPRKFEVSDYILSFAGGWGTLKFFDRSLQQSIGYVKHPLIRLHNVIDEKDTVLFWYSTVVSLEETQFFMQKVSTGI